MRLNEALALASATQSTARSNDAAGIFWTAIPEAGLYHDFTHLLGGYTTEPDGEVEVASFISEFKRERSFYVVLFVALIFSAGVNMRPTADDFVTAGILGKPGMAERMFAAIERGSKVNVDLSDKWDYWAWIELPIDEVRQRMNILPKA